MESNKSKRVVQFEIGDNVKKLTIMGENKDQQVVMREVLGEDELEQVTGGRIQRYYEDESMHHDGPQGIVFTHLFDDLHP